MERPQGDVYRRLRRDEARFFLAAALVVGFFFAAFAFRLGAARFFFAGFAFSAAGVASPTAAVPLSSTLAKLLRTAPVAEMAAEPNEAGAVFAPPPASRILPFAMHVSRRFWVVTSSMMPYWACRVSAFGGSSAWR
jgi:hypothetical protein